MRALVHDGPGSKARQDVAEPGIPDGLDAARFDTHRSARSGPESACR
jgi:hypothetical protein